MRRTFLIVVMVGLFFGRIGFVSASGFPPIRVSTFDSNRSPQWLLDIHNVPLDTNAGSSNIIEGLKDVSKFGGAGAVVGCGVELLPTVEEILPGSLIDGKGMLMADVFFGPILNWAITSTETNELAKFIKAGGIVFVADSDIMGGSKYNPLLEALGVSDRWLGINVYNPPTNFSSPHYAVTPTVVGPFGEVNTLEHRSYRWLDSQELIGVFMDLPDFSLPFVVAEKEFGGGYLAVSSGQIYSNAFTDGNNDNLKYFLNMVAMGCKEETSSDAVVLDVPSLKQYEEPWGSDEYDSAIANNLECGESIGDCGCALTSAAMVMNYYGFGQDPGQVNTDFKSSDWYWQGNFNWWVVGDYAGLSRPSLGYFDEEIIKEYIDDQIPVAVKVRADFTDQHWVVVKGYDDAGLIINDPLFPDPVEGYVHLGDRGYEVFDDGKGVVLYGSVQAPALAMLEGSTLGWFEVFSNTEVSVLKDGVGVGDYFKVGEGDYLGREGNVRVVQPAVEGSYSVEVGPDEMGICDYTIFSSSRDGGIERWDFSNCGGEFWFNGDRGLVVNIGIDVRPANENNFVNGMSHSVFPVAILGSEDLSVFEINKYSLELEGAMIYRPNQKTQLRDVNKDGYLDMVVWFERARVDYLFGGGEACLRGEFKDGLGLMGCDEIKMLPQGLR